MGVSTLGRSIWSGPELDEGAPEGTSGSFPAFDGYSFARVVTWMGIEPAKNTWEPNEEEEGEGSATI